MTRPVEIISTMARRRRWTLEEKVEILDEAFRTGSSVADVGPAWRQPERNVIHACDGLSDKLLAQTNNLSIYCNDINAKYQGDA